MTLTIGPEMEVIAGQLWPRPQRLALATGGLFNRVVRVESSAGTTYLKRFTETASSGDFPPLPTNASQRCLVASSWHELAMRASAHERRVAVPKLLAVQTTFDLVAMEQAPGEPLYDALVGDGRGITAALDDIVTWLGVLHALPLEPRQQLLAASNAFKEFKIDLQYIRILPEIPQVLHGPARSFVAQYLLQESQPVHGDLNSRNILIDTDVTSVIDFEQGHYGDGLYDLAYLLSEYVIRDLRLDINPETVITSAWDGYCDARGRALDSVACRRLRIHLAFQTLYRLVGPSRKVWTGHLNETAQEAVRRWSNTELSRLLQ